MTIDADELVAAVAAGGLLAGGRPVVILLSGGRDSVCLLDVAVRIVGAEAVSGLHVNYGLRDAADGDERHCADLCERLGVHLRVVRAGGAPGSGNVQAWARELRYAEALRAGTDVAAGHTATDQVETILYRLASSPSRRALLGMRAREGRIVRPLLDVSREQTAAYCRARGLKWRDDRSNESPVYARARVRGRLVPALREVHPAAERNVLALAQVLRGEAEVLDELVDGVLGGASEVALARLRELPGALRRLVVQRLADEAAGEPAAGVARRADEVTSMGDSASLDLPHGVRATARGGIVTFGRTPPLPGPGDADNKRAKPASKIRT
ncbi:MAG: tRNA lysidine(34) synthetase TilS [Solirubrobacteraceae bacterium]